MKIHICEIVLLWASLLCIKYQDLASGRSTTVIFVRRTNNILISLQQLLMIESLRFARVLQSQNCRRYSGLSPAFLIQENAAFLLEVSESKDVIFFFFHQVNSWIPEFYLCTCKGSEDARFGALLIKWYFHTLCYFAVSQDCWGPHNPAGKTPLARGCCPVSFCDWVHASSAFLHHPRGYGDGDAMWRWSSK